MGKDLRGKEIGEGIMQRSNGYYSARYTKKNGKQVEKYFDNVAEAYDILCDIYSKRDSRKESTLLSQTLTFRDPRTGCEREVHMKDLIFINFRTGEPIKNSSYDTNLYKICDKAGLRPFCMHALRHTFATRCIERGINPKSLQKILGHAQLSTTMDTYMLQTIH